MPRSRLSESSDADSSASLGATTSSDANEACASGAGRPARVQVPDEEKLTQQLISSSDKVESALADLEALVASADGSSSPPVKIMQLEAMHTLEQVKASCSSLMGSAKLSLRRLPLALNKQPSKSSGGGGSSVFDAESLRISSISEATSIAAPAAAPGSVPPGAVPHHHTPRAGGKQPTAGQRDCFRVKRPSSTVLDLSNRRSVRRVVWANVVAVTMHLGLWFVDWSVAPTIDQDVLLQAATTGINASVREAHQLVYQPPYVAFFALRCTVGLCTFATMVLVFGGGNDAFVLHTLARSAQPIMMGLKLLLYLVFTTMIYAVRGQFDVLQLPRFFLAPCVYVSGMGLIILCDANRRAQKLRWAYFTIALAITLFNTYSRFIDIFPEEQILIAHVGASTFTVQDALRIIDVALSISLMEAFPAVLKRPDLVIFVPFHFTRRQLPVLLAKGFRARLKRARDAESLRLSKAQSAAADEASSRQSRIGSGRVVPTGAPVPPSPPMRIATHTPRKMRDA